MMTSKVDNLGILMAQKDSSERHFWTSFNHLDAHFGIRKGCYSVYMGTPSCGKSSLIKAISIQASHTPGMKVLNWLSEEKKEKYAVNMLRYCEKTDVKIQDLNWFEESKMDHSKIIGHKAFLGAFREIIVASGADIVFIDNLTTSRLYGPETSLSEQGMTVTALKRISQDLDIAIVCVIHTSSKVSDNMGRLFTTEDVRGSRAISLEASYFYSLQKFTKNDEIFVFLRTLKFREHDNAAGTYLLKYDRDYKLHTGDVKVPFEKVNEIFKSRDFLGRGGKQ